MAKQKSPAVELSYPELIRLAAMAHANGRASAGLVASTIAGVLAAGVRLPDQFDFGHHGGSQFRWKNGTNSYSTGEFEKYIDLSVHPDGRLSLYGRLCKSEYNNAETTNIRYLKLADAVTLLAILVRIVDEPTGKTN